MDCTPPVGIALSNSTIGASVGGPGGALYADICPDDEVVIGYAGFAGFDGSATYLQRLAVLDCSMANPYVCARY